MRQGRELAPWTETCGALATTGGAVWFWFWRPGPVTRAGRLPEPALLTGGRRATGAPTGTDTTISDKGL